MIAATEQPTDATRSKSEVSTQHRPVPNAKCRAQAPGESFASGRINVGPDERAVSVLAGALLGVLGLRRQSAAGWAIAAVGGAFVYRGFTGHCNTYDALGIDTSKDHAIHIERAYIIDRPAEELYAFWREFSNLPRIMPHLERVEVFDEKHSHWVARLAQVACGTIEWDAEITIDEPNRRIAWHSLPGGDLHTRGEIRFEPGMGDRGTNVHIIMDYVPPAGRLGHWLATIIGRSPERLLRDELRNFKRVMESGEIPTITGQPHGVCTVVASLTQRRTERT
jgi:uncharacterized membrane protein